MSTSPTTPSANPSNTSSTLADLRHRLVWWRARALIVSEQVGRWITETSSAPLAPVYAAWSQHQSRIVEAVEDRYPVIPHVSEIDLEAETATAMADTGDLAERLAGAHDDDARINAFIDAVLEPMLAAAHDWLAITPPAVDAPTHRLITVLIDDLERDRAAAERLRAAR